MRRTFDNPDSVPAPSGGYSHVVRLDLGTGALLLVSGQIASSESGELVGGDSMVAQAERVFEQLSLILAAHDASIHDPSGGRKAQDDVAEAEPDDGVDGHREQDEREGELDVDDAHEHGRGPALDEAGNEAERPADHRGEDDGAAADEERQARTVQQIRYSSDVWSHSSQALGGFSW